MLTSDSLRKAISLTPRSRTHRPQMQALFSIVECLHPRKYLEIGAFEGRSAILFTLLAALKDRSLPVHLTSVDSWQGGDEHRQGELPMDSVEETYDAVIRECSSWFGPDSLFEKCKGFSDQVMASLRDRRGSYDLILIDAGHKAKDVLVDMVYAWPLLRPGGVMILDDYTWIPNHQVIDFQLHSPKMGIDAFCSCFADELTIISNMPLLQLYLYKNSPLGKHYQALHIAMPDLPEIIESSGLFA